MSYKRILIVNIFGIGDVLFTTPLISVIKRQVPEVSLGYVCNKRAHQVLKTNPKIDQFFIFEKDDYRALYRKSVGAFFVQIKKDLREIVDGRFDIVLDLSLNTHVNFFMFLAGIKERIGFNYKNRSPFLTKKVNILGYEDMHVVEHYLGLLELTGLKRELSPMEVNISQEDREWVDQALLQNGIKSRDRFICLIPGGGASWGLDAKYKRWKWEKYALLADKMIKDLGAKVILLGDSSEVELGGIVVRNMEYKAANLIGRTTIGQYLALLERCSLAVVNDGGPLHMAVAAGTTTVSVFGPVDERVYGPFPPQNHHVVTSGIACRPCYRYFRRADCAHVGCLNQIEVDDVFRAVNTAFKEIL